MTQPNTAPTTQSLIEQYELGDHGFDPDLDAPLEPPAKTLSVPAGAVSPASAAPAPSSPVKPTTPPKDPATGRFVSPATASEHPRGLLRMAKDFGLADEDVAGMPTEQLADTISLLGRERAQWVRDNAAQRYQGNPDAQRQPTPAPEAEAGLGIDEENYDPKIVALAKLVEGLQAQVKQLTAHAQAQANEQAYSEVDRGFSDLGPEFEGIFGKGQGRHMKAGDKGLSRRVAVVNDLRANPPREQVPIREAIKQRAQQMFGDFIQAPRPAPAAVNGTQTAVNEEDERPTADDWRNGTLQRPTNRIGKEPKGPNRAAKAVAAKLREKAINLEEYDGSEEAGLPD